MYKVHKENGTVIVEDWKNNIIFSADSDSIIVYSSAPGIIKTAKIGNLAEEQLLSALAQAVKIAL